MSATTARLLGCSRSLQARAAVVRTGAVRPARRHRADGAPGRRPAAPARLPDRRRRRRRRRLPARRRRSGDAAADARPRRGRRRRRVPALDGDRVDRRWRATRRSAALGKLEQLLPSSVRRQVATIASMTTRLGAAPAPVPPDVLVTVTRACRDGERLRVRYRDSEGRESERTIDPYRVVTTARRWYLVARDRDRDAWRTFRIDRMSEVQRDRPPGRDRRSAGSGRLRPGRDHDRAVPLPGPHRARRTGRRGRRARPADGRPASSRSTSTRRS